MSPRWYYLSTMNPKLKIDGEEADKKFNLRTTQSIFNKLLDKSNGSVNVLINKILLSWKNKQK